MIGVIPRFESWWDYHIAMVLRDHRHDYGAKAPIHDRFLGGCQEHQGFLETAKADCNLPRLDVRLPARDGHDVNGDIAQRESACFASRMSGVQSSLSPPLFIKPTRMSHRGHCTALPTPVRKISWVRVPSSAPFLRLKTKLWARNSVVEYLLGMQRVRSSSLLGSTIYILHVVYAGVA